jgi:hypothetical protein
MAMMPGKVPHRAGTGTLYLRPGTAARLHFVGAESKSGTTIGADLGLQHRRATMRKTVFLTVLLAVGLAFLASAGSDATVAPSLALRSAATSPALTETAALRKGDRLDIRRGAAKTRMPRPDIAALPRRAGKPRPSIEASR